MKTLPYIEDYIDILGCGGPLVWPPREAIIKLARYDTPIVESMSDQINRGIGLSDRQAVLAHKIVVKYRRQWAIAGYDVTNHVDTPKYRLPIRQLDRRRIIDIVDDYIEIRFPYDQDLISKIRASVGEVPGKLAWNPDRKVWQAAQVEPRIIWAKGFGIDHEFDFGQEFDQVFNQVNACPDYAITLTAIDGGYSIANAETSLIDYIHEHIGFDNVIKLIDHSASLGYKVSEDIIQQQAQSDTITRLLTSQTVNLTFEQDITDFQQVVDYARLTNRFPIFVYETGSHQLRDQVERMFSQDQILSAAHHLVSEAELREYPVVYYNHWKAIKYNMPILVTMHTLVIGHRRQQVATRAEKIVYYTQITNNE